MEIERSHGRNLDAKILFTSPYFILAFVPPHRPSPTAPTEHSQRRTECSPSQHHRLTLPPSPPRPRDFPPRRLRHPIPICHVAQPHPWRRQSAVKQLRLGGGARLALPWKQSWWRRSALPVVVGCLLRHLHPTLSHVTDVTSYGTLTGHRHGSPPPPPAPAASAATRSSRHSPKMDFVDSDSMG
jgi:hypothetical protein